MTKFITTQDKEAIKKAIINAVENGCMEPEALLHRLLRSLEKLDNYGELVTGSVSG